MSHLHFSDRHRAAIAVVRAAAPALYLAMLAVSDCTIALQEAREYLTHVLDSRARHPSAHWDGWIRTATERVRMATDALRAADATLDVSALDNWHAIEGAVLGLREAELHHETQQIAIA